MTRGKLIDEVLSDELVASVVSHLDAAEAERVREFIASLVADVERCLSELPEGGTGATSTEDT